MKAEKVPSAAVPYYYDEVNNRFLAHPWHHILFNQCRWYHRLTGGNWRYLQLDSSFANWQRLKWVSSISRTPPNVWTSRPTKEAERE